MENLKSILCPIDFSDKYSINTVKYAMSLGKKFDITPQFLHVSTKPPEVYYRFFPDVTGYLKTAEQNLQDQSNKFIKKVGEPIDIIVRYGTVFQEILQFSNDENIDLIIISAGSHLKYGHQMLSTDSQKVIRKVACPVLTVYGKPIEGSIKKILCPIDLSDRSYIALHDAAILARKFNAKIYLIHIIELIDFDKRRTQKYSSEANFLQFSEMLKNEMIIPDNLKDVEIEKVVRRNIDAATEISYFASENNIDLITLTTHGRSYWPRVLLGSVTEKILQISPCPVLTIRTKK